METRITISLSGMMMPDVERIRAEYNGRMQPARHSAVMLHETVLSET